MAGLGDSLYSGNTRPEVYLRPGGLFAAPPALSSPSGAHSPFALPERLSQDMDRRAARLLESRRHAKESDRAIEPGARAANNHGQSQTQAPGAESPATGLIQAAALRSSQMTQTLPSIRGPPRMQQAGSKFPALLRIDLRTVLSEPAVLSAQRVRPGHPGAGRRGIGNRRSRALSLLR